jgi:hypothetical protein
MDYRAEPNWRLLAAQADMLAELQRRGFIRSADDPLTDLAEALFCGLFGLMTREG